MNMNTMNRNRLVATFLERRGYTEHALAELNDGVHANLLDIHSLACELKTIHDEQKLLVILPDFDMDGISAGTEGFAGFTELGFRVALFRPDPADGYGFTPETICRLKDEFPDVHAILTCDTGITCYAGVAAAQAMGIRVFVTDHHAQQDIRLCADVIVNPNRLDETYENKGICGAHVLWQVLQYYANTFGTRFEQSQIRRLCVFAGIGTISDSMPLVMENRQLVRDACGICRLLVEPFFVDNMVGTKAYLRAFRGLHVVLSLFEEMGKISGPDDIDEEFFGYYLAPMFNAAKRMNGDMNVVFGVFFGNTPDDDARALYELNERRKATVDQYFRKLSEDDQPYAPYVFISEAPSGILGLLATRVMTNTGDPAFVLAKDGNKYHGSGRTPDWYPAITNLSPEGFYIAGHEHAFGIGVTDARELKSLAVFLDKSVDEARASVTVDENAFAPDILISTYDANADSGIDIPLFAEYIREIRDYAPFGPGFEKPRIAFTFHPSDGEWTTMGSVKQHLKISLPYGFEVLCWNQAGRIGELQHAESVVVWGSLGISEFRGRRTVNFVGDAEVMA